MKLTTEQANAIYDILVREAGADNRASRREMFVAAATKVTGNLEYRFCGALGFGGKIWISKNEWYVSASPSDLNYVTVGSIMQANAALASLKTHYDALAEALS